MTAARSIPTWVQASIDNNIAHYAHYYGEQSLEVRLQKFGREIILARRVHMDFTPLPGILKNTKFVYITNFYSEWEGYGNAIAATQKVKEFSNEHGIEFRLQVLASNGRAIHVYERGGFVRMPHSHPEHPTLWYSTKEHPR